MFHSWRELNRIYISLFENLENTPILLLYHPYLAFVGAIDRFSSWKCVTFFKYSRVTAEKFSAQTIPPFSRSLSNHSERQIFLKGCASSFLLKRKSYKISRSFKLPKNFYCIFCNTENGATFEPANDWGAGAEIVWGNEIPNHDFLFIYLYAKFLWSFKRTFKWTL